MNDIAESCCTALPACKSDHSSWRQGGVCGSILVRRCNRPASVLCDGCTAKSYNYYLAIIPKVYDVIVRCMYEERYQVYRSLNVFNDPSNAFRIHTYTQKQGEPSCSIINIYLDTIFMLLLNFFLIAKTRVLPERRVLLRKARIVHLAKLRVTVIMFRENREYRNLPCDPDMRTDAPDNFIRFLLCTYKWHQSQYAPLSEKNF